MLRTFAATIMTPNAHYVMSPQGRGVGLTQKPPENYFWLTEEKVNLEPCHDIPLIKIRDTGEFACIQYTLKNFKTCKENLSLEKRILLLVNYFHIIPLNI